MLYGLKEDTKVLAKPKERAECPCCGGSLVAKCGRVNIWHWAHEAHDPNCIIKPETEWHRGWKQYLRPELCEVHIVKNGVLKIADAVTPNGTVVEFQHSPISVDEIEYRENFYENMIWIFDVGEAFAKGRIEIRYNGIYYKIKWKHAKRVLKYVTKPLYLDIGYGELFRVRNFFDGHPLCGWGYVGTIRDIYSFLHGGKINRDNYLNKIKYIGAFMDDTPTKDDIAEDYQNKLFYKWVNISCIDGEYLAFLAKDGRYLSSSRTLEILKKRVDNYTIYE